MLRERPSGFYNVFLRAMLTWDFCFRQTKATRPRRPMRIRIDGCKLDARFFFGRLIGLDGKCQTNADVGRILDFFEQNYNKSDFNAEPLRILWEYSCSVCLMFILCFFFFFHTGVFGKLITLKIFL